MIIEGEFLSEQASAALDEIEDPRVRLVFNQILAEADQRTHALAQLVELHSEALSTAQKLIAEQTSQLARLEARVAMLEQRPPTNLSAAQLSAINMLLPIGARQS